MPRVPYNPVPTVSPIHAGNQRIQPSVPADAFGANVASAVGSLGKALQGAGNEIFDRAIALQELANTTEAKEAESRYIVESGKLRAEYGALTGKAAVDAYPAFAENMKKVREGIRGSMANDASRRMFDGPSLNTMSYSIANAAGHAAGENRKWAVNASVARVELDGQEAMNNPDDDVRFRGGVRNTVNNVQEIGALQGWPEEKTKLEAQNAVSKLWLKRIGGTARNEPFKAEKMLSDAMESRMIVGDDIESAKKVVEQQRNQVGSRMVAKEVDTDKHKTLAERLDFAELRAEQIAPGDKTFLDMVRSRVDADWNHNRRLEREATYHNRNTIEAGIMGGKSGKVPTTVEELTSDPDVAKAWDGLDDIQRRRYMKTISQNAKGDIQWNNERLRRYQELKGLASEDPNTFLGTNVVEETMPWSAKRELVNIQQKLLGGQAGFALVNKAMGVLAPDLQAAGVTLQNNRTTYLQFKGALDDQIRDFYEQNKKAPKAEEIQVMGRRLLQEQATGRSGWIGSMSFGLIPTSETSRVFETPVPEQHMERIRSDPRWQQNGLTPTDEMIQRIYVREQFKKFYGGSPSSATPTSDTVRRDGGPR